MTQSRNQRKPPSSIFGNNVTKSKRNTTGAFAGFSPTRPFKVDFEYVRKSWFFLACEMLNRSLIFPILLAYVLESTFFQLDVFGDRDKKFSYLTKR